MKLTDYERAVLEAAADQLDRAWDFDEARGLRDGRGGAEYRRTSLAPALRRLAEAKEAK